MSAFTQTTGADVPVRPLRSWLIRTMFGRRKTESRPQQADLSYRYLARQIAGDLPDNGTGRTVLVSSAVPLPSSNEAILTFAYYLSTELGRRVLLVDGTFSDTGVGSVLGHSGAPGLVDAISDPVFPLAQLVQPTGREKVFLLPAGSMKRTGQAVPIDPARIVGFYQYATGNYDYVLVQQGAIFDEPRYLQFTAGAEMILMLVDEGVTPVEIVHRCTAVFRAHQVSNVRLIVTVPR